MKQKNITFNLGNKGGELTPSKIFDTLIKEKQADEGKKLKDLPQFGSATLKLPPFFAIPTKKGWKLANPLTEIRNLAKRQHTLSIKVKRSNVNKPELDLSVPRVVPTLEDFSAKDRKKLQDYYKAVKDGKEEEYLFKNKPRGFPVTLYKNAEKAGYKETTKKVYRKNEVKSKAVKVSIKAPKPVSPKPVVISPKPVSPKPAVISPKPVSAEQPYTDKKNFETMTNNIKKKEDQINAFLKEKQDLTKEMKSSVSNERKNEIEKQIDDIDKDLKTLRLKNTLAKKSMENLKKHIKYLNDLEIEKGEPPLTENVLKTKFDTFIEQANDIIKEMEEMEGRKPFEDIVDTLIKEKRDLTKEMKSSVSNERKNAIEKRINDIDKDIKKLRIQMSRLVKRRNKIEIQIKTIIKKNSKIKMSGKMLEDITKKEDELYNLLDKLRGSRGQGLNEVTLKKSKADTKTEIEKISDYSEDNDNGDNEGMGGSLLGQLGKKIYKGYKERVKKNIHRITHPRETIKEAKDFTRHLIHGRHDAYPPSAQKVIDENKGAIVQAISLHRNPLPSVYTKLMNWATNGETDKRIAEQPKDTLYHIGMWVKLSNGKTIKVEKNEVINIEANPTKPKEEEVFQISNVVSNLTFGDMLEKTRREIGDHKYFSYSAKDNNCGNYIENILKTNRMDNEATHDFINQDTKEILRGFPSLRKFINTVTDIGGRANVLLEGGDIDAQSQHFQHGKGVNIIDWEDMKWGSFTKQFEEYKRQHPSSKINDLEHFAESILANPEDYKKTTLKRARFYINVIAKKKLSHHNNIMPIKGGKLFGLSHSHLPHPALVSDQYPRIPQAFAQVHLAHPFPIGNGLYAGGRLSLDEITGGARHMLGVGIPSPHSRSPITDPSLLGGGLLEKIGSRIKHGVERNILGAKQMSGRAIPSPHSRSPITDPSASGVGRYNRRVAPEPEDLTLDEQRMLFEMVNILRRDGRPVTEQDIEDTRDIILRGEIARDGAGGFYLTTPPTSSQEQSLTSSSLRSLISSSSSRSSLPSYSSSSSSSSSSSLPSYPSSFEEEERPPSGSGVGRYNRRVAPQPPLTEEETIRHILHTLFPEGISPQDRADIEERVRNREVSVNPYTREIEWGVLTRPTTPEGSGLKKSRPVKGSAEAKAWGAKMRALRKK